MYVDQRQVDVRHRRRDRPADLAHAGASSSPACSASRRRRDQPRRGDDLQRQALSRDDRQPPARARHEDRQGGLEPEVRRLRKRATTATGAPIVANGVLISGMAGGESTTRGFLDGWDPETGQEAVAPLHDSGARRAGLRDLAEGQRRLEVRRRRRPGARARTIRSSISSTGAPAMPSRTIRRPRGGARQPVHVERARDPAEDRRDRLPLPVHAERRVRRRRHRRARARRHPGRAASCAR